MLRRRGKKQYKETSKEMTIAFLLQIFMYYEFKLMEDNVAIGIFRKNFQNQAQKASKIIKGKHNATLDELGGKENIVNDVIWNKEGLNKLDLLNLYEQKIYEFLYEKEINMWEPNFQMSSLKINDIVRVDTVRYIVKLVGCFNLILFYGLKNLPPKYRDWRFGANFIEMSIQQHLNMKKSILLHQLLIKCYKYQSKECY